MRDYGGYIYDDEAIADDDRIHRVADGIASVDALRNIMLVSERALFESIVSGASMQEADAAGHMRWLWDIAAHSIFCLEAEDPTAESDILGARLNEPKFGYLSDKDRVLVQHAIILRCEAGCRATRHMCSASWAYAL